MLFNLKDEVSLKITFFMFWLDTSNKKCVEKLARLLSMKSFMEKLAL